MNRLVLLRAPSCLRAPSSAHTLPTRPSRSQPRPREPPPPRTARLIRCRPPPTPAAATLPSLPCLLPHGRRLLLVPAAAGARRGLLRAVLQGLRLRTLVGGHGELDERRARFFASDGRSPAALHSVYAKLEIMNPYSAHLYISHPHASVSVSTKK